MIMMMVSGGRGGYIGVYMVPVDSKGGPGPPCNLRGPHNGSYVAVV